jgi:hypothetical protein
MDGLQIRKIVRRGNELEDHRRTETQVALGIVERSLVPEIQKIHQDRRSGIAIRIACHTVLVIRHPRFRELFFDGSCADAFLFPTLEETSNPSIRKLFT